MASQFAPMSSIHLSPRVTNCPCFQFQFRICPQFLHKPQLPDLNPADPSASDISLPPVTIASIPPSHTLTLNAFPVPRPSYLLLTTSPTHKQTSPLDLSDVAAACTVLNRLEQGDDGKEYMVIYNCGRDAGCSRSHKHMQLFPRPLDFVLLPDRTPEEIATMNVPFLYYVFRVGPSLLNEDDIPPQILSGYLGLLQHARSVLGIEEGHHVPHNVVLVRSWIVVIPRRRAGVGGVSANALGMLGIEWVGTKEKFEEWETRGGRSVLRELGVAVADDYYAHRCP